MNIQASRYLFFIYILLLCGQARAEERLLVLYPEVAQSATQAFQTIVSAMQADTRFSLILKPIPPRVPPADLQNWVEETRPALVIIMGKAGLQALGYPTEELPVRIAASYAFPQSVSKIETILSSTPHPKLMFEIFKQSGPQLNTVHVVLDETRWGWLLEIAHKTSREMGFMLKVHHADTVQQGARALKQLLPGMDTSTDALWFSQDDNTNNDAIKSMILKWGWRSNLRVVTNDRSDVSGGMLFGVDGSNEQIGRGIIQIARRVIDGTVSAPILPLPEAQGSVNMRTAHKIISANPMVLELITKRLPEDAR